MASINLLLVGAGILGVAAASQFIGGSKEEQPVNPVGGGGGGTHYLVKKSTGAPTGSSAAPTPTKIILPEPNFPMETKKEQKTTSSSSGGGGGGGSWRVTYEHDTTAHQLGYTYNASTNKATDSSGGTHDYNTQQSYWDNPNPYGGGTKKDNKPAAPPSFDWGNWGSGGFWGSP